MIENCNGVLHLYYFYQKLFEAAVLALTPESIMSQIFVFRVFDQLEQMACIKQLSDFMKQHSQVVLYNCSLFVCDSYIDCCIYIYRLG